MPLANNLPLLGFRVQRVDHSLVLADVSVIPGSVDGFELVDLEDFMMTMKLIMKNSTDEEHIYL